jgi:hypothetical protein
VRTKIRGSDSAETVLRVRTIEEAQAAARAALRDYGDRWAEYCAEMLRNILARVERDHGARSP